MRSKILPLVLMTLTSFILSSCHTTVSITKRHYSSGFYVDISNRKAPVNVSKADVPASPQLTAEGKEESPQSLTSENNVKEGTENYSTINAKPEAKQKTAVSVTAKKIATGNVLNIRSKRSIAQVVSSEPSAKHVAADADRYLKLWLICLGAALVLWVLRVWFLSWIAWIAFLVFFILWLIEIAR